MVGGRPIPRKLQPVYTVAHQTTLWEGLFEKHFPIPTNTGKSDYPSCSLRRFLDWGEGRGEGGTYFQLYACEKSFERRSNHHFR
jgi:hypothetical protein